MIHSSMSLSVGVFVASARPAWYIINEVLWKTRRCFSADYIRHCLAVLLSVQTGLCRAAGAGCRRPIISDVKVWGSDSCDDTGTSLHGQRETGLENRFEKT